MYLGLASDPNLFIICIWSFLVVFILLGILAIMIRLVTAIFPGADKRDDTAMVAAIHSTVAATLPGARVTRIEEIHQ